MRAVTFFWSSFISYLPVLFGAALDRVEVSPCETNNCCDWQGCDKDFEGYVHKLPVYVIGGVLISVVIPYFPDHAPDNVRGYVEGDSESIQTLERVATLVIQVPLIVLINKIFHQYSVFIHTIV